MLNREIVLHKLADLLEEKISTQEIYSWVLGLAMRPEYQESVSSDPLLHSVFQDLLNVTQVSESRRPTREALVYYQSCLSGQEEFRKEIVNHLLAASYRKRRNQEDDRPVAPPGKFYLGFRFLTRGYLYLFAIAIMGIHVISLLKPDLAFFNVSDGQGHPVWRESAPQLTYAFILMVPFRWLIRTPWTLFSLPALIYGCYYYWAVSFDLISKLAENGLLLIIILPFGAFPATLALLLFLLEWKHYRGGRF